LENKSKEQSKDTITTKKASINKYSKENSKNYGTYNSDILNCTEVLPSKIKGDSQKYKMRYYEDEESSVDVYENHSRKVKLVNKRKSTNQIYQILRMKKISH
jgi:cell division septum initiation protein DivIVA